MTTEATSSEGPLCVLGMHRSGTSVVTHLCGLLGYDLGPEPLHAPAGPDNPAGFFEIQALREINDSLLAYRGGSWDAPPSLKAPWPPEPVQAELRREAGTVIAETFGARRRWVWKDPRTMLALTFWESVIPDQRHLWCVRDPRAVARSLAARDGMSREYGLQLWGHYVTSACEGLAGRSVPVVHYEDLLTDPASTVEALARALACAVPPRETWEGVIRPDLRHEREDGEDPEEFPEPVASLYAALRAVPSGGMFAPFEMSSTPEPAEAEIAERLRHGIADRERTSAARLYLTRTAQAEQHMAELDERDRELASLRHGYAQQLQRLQELERVRDAGRQTGGALRRAVWDGLRRGFRLMPLGRAPRRLAKRAFYGAVSLVAPDSRALQVYRESERIAAARVAPASAVSPVGGRRRPGPADIVMFGVIDWAYRHQRPQHLAQHLARRGHRVFYVSHDFTRAAGTAELRVVADGVIEICLPAVGDPPSIYEGPIPADQASPLAIALEQALRAAEVGACAAIVQHPGWVPVVERLTPFWQIYDCMDYHSGFANTGARVEAAELALFAGSDRVVVSAEGLAAVARTRREEVALIRNGADVERFAGAAPLSPWSGTRPVAGYVGAIAEWFDAALLAEVARQLADWDFVLVGGTAGADLSELRALSNVHLVGEVPYPEVPGWVHRFDVCLIPFRITPLTLCTNPVKAYEYLAAGKPVVSTPLPEVRAMQGLVQVADDAGAFARAITEAIRSRDAAVVAARQAFARDNSWAARGERLSALVSEGFPQVSVIVVTYNNLAFTQACLEGLEQFTRYPSWELVIVDNASTDGTPAWLAQYAAARAHVRVIANSENRGFAAANNQGVAAATGDVFVLLNNDTFVTVGWLGTLIRHLRDDPEIGLIGPVTNNIGNEARIAVAYRDMAEMARVAERYTTTHRGRRFEIPSLAFFCVAIPRDVWEAVGPLDEAFGRGFFEDDDYVMRVRKLGRSVQCAEDVFVHHHLSASFSQVPDPEREALFERNRAYFESKWGPWQAHRYRASGDQATSPSHG